MQGALFHIHEEAPEKNRLEPLKIKGVTALIGLFVSNVDDVTQNCIKAGAIEISAPQDFDYGYRQAGLKGPFGHYWLIQQKI